MLISLALLQLTADVTKTISRCEVLVPMDHSLLPQESVLKGQGRMVQLSLTCPRILEVCRSWSLISLNWEISEVMGIGMACALAEETQSSPLSLEP